MEFRFSNDSQEFRYLKKFLPHLDFDWQPNILQNDRCAISKLLFNNANVLVTVVFFLFMLRFEKNLKTEF